MEKWKYSFLGLLILVSCAQVEHKGEVDVNVSLDLTELEKYFEPVCREELPETVTDEQVEDCINEKIGSLLELLSQISPT